MTRKAVQTAVDIYQRARLCFVQTVSTLADKALTRPILQEMNILDLLLPLLDDKVPSIKQAALATLGKMLCAKDLNMKQEIKDRDLLRVMLRDLAQQNKYYKRTALHMISCAVHDNTFAKMIGHKELETIMSCLNDPEPETRASAAAALGCLARESQKMAMELVMGGQLPALSELLASPEITLKLGAASALGNIAKHSKALAENVADYNVIPLVAQAVHNGHVRMKADGLLCLANIAKHSPELAAEVAETALNDAIEHLTHQHGQVQKQAATLVRDICRHDLQLANMVVQSQGLESLVKLVQCGNECSSLPAIMALGYMASQSEQIAEQIIKLDGVHALRVMLQCEGNEQLQAASAWTLGQIGKHSADNVNALTVENVLSTLIEKISNPGVSENLNNKCRSALRLLLPKCKDTRDLEKVLRGDNIPEALLAPILSAFAKILPCYPETKVSFINSGCLRKIQELEPDQETTKYIQTILDCFPKEVVQFVSPNYLDSLIEKLEAFVLKDMPSCDDMVELTPVESVSSFADSIQFGKMSM